MEEKKKTAGSEGRGGDQTCSSSSFSQASWSVDEFLDTESKLAWRASKSVRVVSILVIISPHASW